MHTVILSSGTLSPGTLSPGTLSPGTLSPGTPSEGSLSKDGLSPETRPDAAAHRRGTFRSHALLLLAAITAARLVWLVVQPADLYPDEAQYWFWAQHPAFGYYSKPPLIAWL